MLSKSEASSRVPNEFSLTDDQTLHSVLSGVADSDSIQKLTAES
jgi:hypothetical protein